MHIWERIRGWLKKATHQEWLEQGDKMLSSGDFGQAEEAFKEAIQKEPKKPEGHAGLLRVYLHQNHLTKALTALRQIPSELQDQAIFRYLEAVVSSLQIKSLEHEAYLRWMALPKDPIEALKEMRSLACAHPRCTPLLLAWIEMGFQLSSLNDINQALYWLRDGEPKIEDLPFPLLYARRDTIHLQSQPKALEAIEKAATVADPNERLRILRPFASSLMDLVPLQYDVGLAFFQANKPTIALRFLQRAALQNPFWLQGWFHLGIVALACDRYERAREAYQQIILLSESESASELVDELEALLLQHPEIPFHERALDRLAVGDPFHAVDLLKKAMVKNPDDWKISLSMAQALSQTHREPEAFNVLAATWEEMEQPPPEEAKEVAVQLEEITFRLIRPLAKDGKRNEIRRLFSRLRDLTSLPRLRDLHARLRDQGLLSEGTDDNVGEEEEASEKTSVSAPPPEPPPETPPTPAPSQKPLRTNQNPTGVLTAFSFVPPSLTSPAAPSSPSIAPPPPSPPPSPPPPSPPPPSNAAPPPASSSLPPSLPPERSNASEPLTSTASPSTSSFGSSKLPYPPPLPPDIFLAKSTPSSKIEEDVPEDPDALLASLLPPEIADSKNLDRSSPSPLPASSKEGLALPSLRSLKSRPETSPSDPLSPLPPSPSPLQAIPPRSVAPLSLSTSKPPAPPPKPTLALASFSFSSSASTLPSLPSERSDDTTSRIVEASLSPTKTAAVPTLQSLSASEIAALTSEVSGLFKELSSAEIPVIVGQVAPFEEIPVIVGQIESSGWEEEPLADEEEEWDYSPSFDLESISRENSPLEELAPLPSHPRSIFSIPSSSSLPAPMPEDLRNRLSPDVPRLSLVAPKLPSLQSLSSAASFPDILSLMDDIDESPKKIRPPASASLDPRLLFNDIEDEEWPKKR